ncbi:hypothetical protein U4Z51_22785, partial [Escherichia coli]|nr:hypothetical protein [Escherichia coli]
MGQSRQIHHDPQFIVFLLAPGWPKKKKKYFLPHQKTPHTPFQKKNPKKKKIKPPVVGVPPPLPKNPPQ